MKHSILTLPMFLALDAAEQIVQIAAARYKTF